MKDLIKWTLYKETEFPILVGEFQVAAKFDFTSSRIGKKKLEAKKDELAKELKNMLEELVSDRL